MSIVRILMGVVFLGIIGLVPNDVCAKRHQPISSTLIKTVAVSWDKAPLQEIFEWLAAQGDYNVVVQWRSLKLGGIDANTPVTLALRNVSVGAVLSEVLDSISGLDSITYHWYGNIIKISTKSALVSNLYTRVYDISDLFFSLKDFEGPQIDLQQQHQSGAIPGEQSQLFRPGRSNDNETDESDERSAEIIELIRAAVEPNSWEGNGGLGSVSIFNRQLIIRNTINVHILLAGSFNMSE